MEHGGVWVKGVSSPPPVSLYTVANLSACGQVNSEALVHCLRGKSEEEILAINKVRLIVWVWGKGQYIGFEESVLTKLK
jgi:carboxylesterase 2